MTLLLCGNADESQSSPPFWLHLLGGLHSGQVAAVLYLHMACVGLLTCQA